MLFLHIVDDFYLQGILAQLKQKDWWKYNYPDKLYKYDWIISLFLHCFSWAFMVMLPYTILYETNSIYIITFISLVVVHFIVDDLKANQKKINLTIDQITHIGQIILAWSDMTTFGGLK